MARISTYPYDTIITDDDAWIGTESTNRSTRQFTAKAVANYLNVNGRVAIGGQVSFKWSNSINGGVGTIARSSGGGTGSSISSLTQIRLSTTELSGQNVVKFLEYITTRGILIGQGDEISQFGNFKLTSYVVDPSNASYYIADIEFIGGNGVIADDDALYTIIYFDINTGIGGGTYTFTQAVPLTTWSIQHDLGGYPSVSVVNNNNVLMYGQTTYIDNNNLQINFSAGFSGKAYLN